MYNCCMVSVSQALTNCYKTVPHYSGHVAVDISELNQFTVPVLALQGKPFVIL